MSYEIVTALIGLFCTTASSLITFFLTKKKYNTEVDSQQIKNMDDSFNVYKKMMEETLLSQKKLMEATIEHQNNVIDAQNKKIDGLQKENEALRKQVADLQIQLIQFFGVKFKEETNKSEGNESTD